ncbi:hypothetical protein PV08_03865 [Exophiala spinifera]|uniref:Epoxide hydrolase N-terminal domain-containing protein n=1 Tax=Exophiala spinifera TaxID=91928 RepID=A0A0D1ZVC5_9EURO|nr:uncharacterized protein PV08_03865 [Exophiala spinifera]KIW16677.1 hypothetical protein PV08_03865 [Exophiala spinifera]
MAYRGFDILPSQASDFIMPWKVAVPQKDLENLRTLLELSEVAPPTYENSLPEGERHLGLRREWVATAKEYWESKFDWRKHEEHINSFPHFKVPVKDDLETFDIHFLALFSRREDAIPILLLHGWPGSFLEFLPLLDILRTEHTADTLPYHLIVPSLPGYAFSSPPPLSPNFRPDDAARIFDSLASTLGFEAYMVQGGDLGGRIGRIMAANHPRCKALHLNTHPMPAPDPSELRTPLTESEQAGLERHAFFLHNGTGYAIEHATRPSTIGFVISSNPLALLSWIGEKFLDWTDEDPSLDTILASITLYWVTKCASTSIWAYRQFYGPNADSHGSKKWHVHKPLGYSWFPKEINPIPRAWIETTGNLVFFHEHDKGGHFAAMERPRELWADVEEFIADVKGEFNS